MRIYRKKFFKDFKRFSSNLYVLYFFAFLVFILIFNSSSVYSATPIITDISPVNNEILNTRSFNISLTTDISSVCKYDYVDVDYDDMNYFLNSTDYKSHRAEINESSDGDFVYYFYCRAFTTNSSSTSNTTNTTNTTNTSSTTTSDTSELHILSLSIDTIPPKIIDYSPKTDVITTNDFVLSVSLDEAGSCRMSLNNVSYYTMTDDLVENSKDTFTKSLEFNFDGERSYYIDCIDSAGNTLKDRFKFSLDFELPPTARIIFDKSPPLAEGTYKITLITSEPVKQTPSLKYTFDGSKYYYVPLTGTDTEWTGYMVINDVGKSNALVGSFAFVGEDLSGNIGTLITSNKIFLVDTKRPVKITTIKAASKENGHIKLVWNYNDIAEEVSEFKIYRSTSKSINTLDFYDDSSTEYFLDDVVIPGTTYYYSVAAVDDAGNIGPLSNSIEVKSELATKINKTFKKNTLDPKSEKLYKDTKAELKELLSNLTEIENKSSKEYFSVLGFSKNIDAAKTNIDTTLKSIESLKENYKDYSTFNEQVSKLLSRIINQKSNIPKTIVERNLKSYENIITSDDLQNSIYENFNSLRLNELDDKKKEKYSKLSSELNNNYAVSYNVKLLDITFLDGKKRTFTLFSKNITLKPGVDINKIKKGEDFSLIETIPKELASTSSEVIFFNSKNIDVIKKDPIFRISFNGSNMTYNYLIGKDCTSELEQNQPTSVVLLNALDYFFEKKDSSFSITGNLIKPLSSSSNFLYFFLALVVVGLLVYYFKIDTDVIEIKDSGMSSIKTFSTNFFANFSFIPKIFQKKEVQNYYDDSGSKLNDSGENNNSLGNNSNINTDNINNTNNINNINDSNNLSNNSNNYFTKEIKEEKTSKNNLNHNVNNLQDLHSSFHKNQVISNNENHLKNSPLLEKMIDFCDMVVRENYNLVKNGIDSNKINLKEETNNPNNSLKNRFNCKPDEFFILGDKKLFSLMDLIKELDIMSDETFEIYSNPQKNDFYNWIKNSFERDLSELAESIRYLSKKEMKDYLLNYIFRNLF